MLEVHVCDLTDTFMAYLHHGMAWHHYTCKHLKFKQSYLLLNMIMSGQVKNDLTEMTPENALSNSNIVLCLHS